MPGDAAIGADDLAQGIVTPSETAAAPERSNCLGSSGAVTHIIHSVVVFRNRRSANFIFLHIQDIAIWLVSIEGDVRGAGGGV